MPVVHGHVEQRQALPEHATCGECHRTFHPRNEEQALMELCDHCYEDIKYPHERVISVHVHARPTRPNTK